MCEMLYRFSNLKITLFKIFNFSAFINHHFTSKPLVDMSSITASFYCNAQLCSACIHIQYYGIVSATGDVAIKKPKVEDDGFSWPQPEDSN